MRQVNKSPAEDRPIKKAGDLTELQGTVSNRSLQSGSPLRGFAFVFGKVTLPEADAFGSDFNQLVIVDKFKCKFKRYVPGRRQLNRFVRSGSTHVGEFFLSGRIDYQITAFVVHPHNHPFIKIVLGADKKFPALLQTVQSVGNRLSV